LSLSWIFFFYISLLRCLSGFHDFIVSVVFPCSYDLLYDCLVLFKWITSVFYFYSLIFLLLLCFHLQLFLCSDKICCNAPLCSDQEIHFNYK
jgi:hypothetical protein